MKRLEAPASLILLSAQDGHRLKKCSGHSAGDPDEFPRSGEDFHEGGLAENSGRIFVPARETTATRSMLAIQSTRTALVLTGLVLLASGAVLCFHRPGLDRTGTPLAARRGGNGAR